MIQAAEYALGFISASSACTVGEVFGGYPAGTVQSSLLSSVCRALYGWVAVALVHDPDTVQDNVDHATEVLKFLFREAEPVTFCAFFLRVSDLEDQDYDATLARSVMATTFVAQVSQDKELEQYVFQIWDEDVGSWSELVGEPVSGRWFECSRRNEFDEDDFSWWADSYQVPSDLRKAVSDMARSYEGSDPVRDEDAGGGVVDLALRFNGGVPAMYAWVARSLGGMGVRLWDTSRVVLMQLLTTDDSVQEGMRCFQKELGGLRADVKRAAVRSFTRAVVVQQKARRLSGVARTVLCPYLGSIGRWQGHLTLQLKQDALKVFDTSFN